MCCSSGGRDWLLSVSLAGRPCNSRRVCVCVYVCVHASGPASHPTGTDDAAATAKKGEFDKCGPELRFPGRVGRGGKVSSSPS